MLSRALFTPDGRIRRRRMIPTFIALVVLALLGSLLVTFAPAAADTPALFNALIGLGIASKLPLIALIAWLMLRNREWPSRPPNWSKDEVGEILDYIRSESARAEGREDATDRLTYLRDEAWHVADRAEDAQTPEAVALALEIQAAIERSMGAPTRGQRRGG